MTTDRDCLLQVGLLYCVVVVEMGRQPLNERVLEGAVVILAYECDRLLGVVPQLWGQV